MTGSLREAVADIADGGTITFDPGLAGGTVSLFGPITLMRDVTIDASDAPGISLDGLATDRVLIVDPGATATVAHLTMTNGFGFQLAGCVLNNGRLTLDHVTVTGCLMTTDAHPCAAGEQPGNRCCQHGGVSGDRPAWRREGRGLRRGSV